MKKKGLVLGSIAALGLSGTALADGFDYSFVEAGYVAQDIEGASGELDGFGLRGSLKVTDTFHTFVNYADLDLDGPNAELFELGGGLNWSLNPNLDFVGTVSLLRAEQGRADDDGFGLGLGLRGRLHERLELSGGVGYSNFDDLNDSTAFEIGTRYFFTPAVAVGADVSFSNDDTVWSLGGRFSFGK